MEKTLAALLCHDPGCKLKAADIVAAHTKASKTASPAAAAHLLYARKAMELYVAEPSDFLLDLARAELLKAGWSS